MKRGQRGRQGKIENAIPKFIGLINTKHAGSILSNIELASAWRKEKASRQICHRPPGSSQVIRLRCCQAEEASLGQMSFKPGVNIRSK